MAGGDLMAPPLLLLFAMFVAARLPGRAGEMVGLPGVLVPIPAGILPGPSAFGINDPANVDYGITLEALAEIGIVVLLFSVGLETRIGDLKRVGRAASQTAMLGVAVPLAVGTAVLMALAYEWHAAPFV